METFIVNENGERNIGGRIVCGVCGWQGGVRWTKSNRGDDIHKWTHRITCPKCKSTERAFRMSGIIVEQKLAQVI